MEKFQVYLFYIVKGCIMDMVDYTQWWFEQITCNTKISYGKQLNFERKNEKFF